jgi:hypothetical protein
MVLKEALNLGIPVPQRRNWTVENLNNRPKSHGVVLRVQHEGVPPKNFEY